MINTKAISYCFAKGIKVIVVPQRPGKNPDVKLQIHTPNKIIHGNQVYKQDKTLWDKVNQLYNYYYEVKKH